MSAGMALVAATTVIGIGSALVQGQQEKQSYEYNADITERELTSVEAARQVREMRSRNDMERMYSSQIAAVASSGIEMTGSPVEVINADLTQAEFDIAIDNYNFEREKTRIRNEAQMQRYYGKQAKRAGILRAVGAGVSGLAGMAGARGAFAGEQKFGGGTKSYSGASLPPTSGGTVWGGA